MNLPVNQNRNPFIPAGKFGNKEDIPLDNIRLDEGTPCSAFRATICDPEKDLGIVTVSLKEDCLIMDEHGVVVKFRLEKARVEWMQTKGILISGLVDSGNDKIYREVFLRYI